MALPEHLWDARGHLYRPGCRSCRHFEEARGFCAVFGTAPPLPILAGEHDHRLPFPGDGGGRWEPDAAHVPPGLSAAGALALAYEDTRAA